ncbi:MAG: 30S ribosomal protein S8e [Promethearchaeota archaeon]
MVIYQERSKRKFTGAKYHTAHNKRKNRMGRVPIETKIDEERKKIVRTCGGNIKIKAYSLDSINVTDPKTNKTKKTSIKRLDTNKASIDYQRRSILTKGAVVETEMGKVRITSRPGQCGQVSGVIIDSE